MRTLKKKSPIIGVIADDLTGCGDVGVFLNKAGLTARIILDTRKMPAAHLCKGCDALLLNTDSRRCVPRTAYRRVYDAAGILKKFRIQFFFKKIDSTLRGNIGPELDAFIQRLHLKKLHLVAAFPQMGRTTRQGRQFVKNKPVDKTFFNTDPRNTIVSSHIPTLLRTKARYAERIQVMDAVTARDLQKIVERNGAPVYAGAAGIIGPLIHAWVLHIPQLHCITKVPRVTGIGKQNPAMHKTLIVCGSMHPINKRQIREIIGQKKSLTGNTIRCMKRERIFWIVQGPERRGDPETVSRNIIRTVSKLFLKEKFEKIILIGGDTAQRICRMLKIKYLDVINVLDKGIVITQSDAGHAIVLKPGGFGNRDSLKKCIESVHEKTK